MLNDLLPSLASPLIDYARHRHAIVPGCRVEPRDRLVRAVRTISERVARRIGNAVADQPPDPRYWCAADVHPVADTDVDPLVAVWVRAFDERRVSSPRDNATGARVCLHREAPVLKLLPDRTADGDRSLDVCQLYAIDHHDEPGHLRVSDRGGRSLSSALSGPVRAVVDDLVVGDRCVDVGVVRGRWRVRRRRVGSPREAD